MPAPDATQEDNALAARQEITKTDDNKPTHPAIIHTCFVLGCTGLFTGLNAAGHELGKPISNAIFTSYRQPTTEEGLHPTVAGSAIVLFITALCTTTLSACDKSTPYTAKDALKLLPYIAGANCILSALATALSAQLMYHEDFMDVSLPAAYTTSFGTIAITIPIFFAVAIAKLFHYCCGPGQDEENDIPQPNRRQSDTSQPNNIQPGSPAPTTPAAPQVVVIPITPTDLFNGQNNERNVPRITFQQNAQVNTDAKPSSSAVQVATP